MDVDMKYLRAPAGWDETQPNPFTPDGSYGAEWSVFRLRDEDDDRMVNVRRGVELYKVPVPEDTDGPGRNNGPYCYVLGRGVKDIDTRLADFLRYETGHGRKVIVALPQDTDTDAVVDQALAGTPERRAIRPEDPMRWVHSTPLENWESIRACGELRSLGRLRREGESMPGVGIFAFGEPDDYADYVMLAWAAGIGCEHVVSSQQKGYLITEEDTPYTPGVRLYFDGHRIIRDGLAVSDGLHTLKVHDHLPLEPYMVAAIGVKDVDPEGAVEVWTPRTFLDAANECFAGRHDV